jgi:broad specificity phosphatase PhoE
MGNTDASLLERVPDHKLPLTNTGRQQAVVAGQKLRAHCESTDRVAFFTSPYKRARETFEGIAPAFEDVENVLRIEEPRLRELDWGNYQDLSEMERIKKMRGEYGHFFFRVGCKRLIVRVAADHSTLFSSVPIEGS